MCPHLWYLLAAAAVQPPLLHRVCHCVCHLFSLSITSSLCPDPGAAQSVADLALSSPCAPVAQPRQESSPGPSHPSWLSAALHQGHNPQLLPPWKQSTRRVLCCPGLTMEGAVEPSGTCCPVRSPSPSGGTWGHPPTRPLTSTLQ